MSRSGLNRLGKMPVYREVVNHVKAIIEDYAESQLYSRNVAGAIFWLKNYGWSDRPEGQDTTVLVSVSPEGAVKYGIKSTSRFNKRSES